MEKSKALTKLQSARDAGHLVYARDEEITMLRQQFETLITTIGFAQEHFCKTGSKKVGDNYEDVFYPQKQAQNQIAEACGISFTENCGTKERGTFSELRIDKQDGLFIVVGDYSVIGWAQGIRLKPDGQPRASGVCEYEYSVSDRFNLEISLSKYPPKTIQEARRKLLETKKFSTRKADTGSKLAVIRELANIPTGFLASDIKKPMVFTQIIESNEYKHNLMGALMSTDDGRQRVADAMLGTKAKLFGKSDDVDNEGSEPGLLESSSTQAYPENVDEIPFVDEISLLKKQLIEWTMGKKIRVNLEEQTEIDKLVVNDNATLEDLKRITTFLEENRLIIK
ncbi:MAG: hypothetical protein GY797_33510 [Deltaproteobacteria bacterium]|nr:hypothetical protein [Deltaproteobacteria bacterium]